MVAIDEKYIPRKAGNSGPQSPTVAWQGKQGYQFEQALGLQYIRQRWYDPSTRQFISPDPLGFAAGDTNLFRYAGNNPVNRNDPGGQDTIDDLTALPGAPLPPVPPAPLTPRQPTHPILRRGSIAGHGGTSALPFENLFQPTPQLHGLGPIEATMNPLASHFDPRPYDILSSGVSAGLAIAVQIHNQDVRMALAGQLDPNMIEGPWGYRFVSLTTDRGPGSGAYLGTGLMIYGAPLAIAAGGAVRVAWSAANVTVGTIQAVSGTVHGMREFTHHHITAGLINLAGAGLGIFVAHGGLRGMGAPTWSETVAGLNAAENTIEGNTPLVRVTQFYNPSRGTFGPGASTALSSPAPTNPLLRLIEGPTGGAWVAPQSAEDMNWFLRMMTGRGNYIHYVEFSVSPSELQNPSGVKFIVSPFQQVVPNTVDLAGRNAVFGQLAPNYGQMIFFIGVGSSAATSGGYLIYQDFGR